MKKIIFEYTAILQKEVEIPDDIYDIVVNDTEDFQAWKVAWRYMDNLCEKLLNEDKNAEEARGFYTTEEEPIAEY